MHKAAVLYLRQKNFGELLFSLRQNNPADVSVYNDPSTYNENQRSMYLEVCTAAHNLSFAR
jgi:hypothetical protein